MSYSLTQAASATGKDRSTIQRAIKSGRISASLNDAGAYEIDPAELHRVFPPIAPQGLQNKEVQQSATALQLETESENRELRAKVELLREMVDDLRERLDQESEERRRLTLLITHQPEPTRASKTAPAVRPAVWITAAVIFTAAAIFWAWWNHWTP